MFSSKKYWEDRYRNNGNSGLGSYGHEANFKAEYINDLILKREIKTIGDIGCGDGNQISLLFGFDQYTGYDFSETVIDKCEKKYEGNNKIRFVYSLSEMDNVELIMSLDVTYHIIEDDLFIKYLNDLFSLSNKYVLIYSVNSNVETTVPHMKYRKFVEWIYENMKNVKLIDEKKYPNKNNGIGFYLFEK